MFLDDDTNFLDALNHYLGIPNSHFFTSPEIPISILSSSNAIKRIQKRLFQINSSTLEELDTNSEYYPFLINFHALHEEIYNPSRFEDTSVLVVDYHMGDINGIAVCEKLAQHPAKKILLTGSPEKESVAIDAFNQGIIHYFVSKSDPEFAKKLKTAVIELQQQYFKEVTRAVFDNLLLGNALLQTIAYEKLILSIKEETKAVEYYLLDNIGSMIFVNEKGSPTWLNIKEESELINYENIAKDLGVNNELIELMAKRMKIPFFFDEKDHQLLVEQWNDIFYEAKKLEGIEGYYACIIHGNKRGNLDETKLVSYDSHLNNKSN
jgi:CheY-like chemotaxis protein